MASIQLKSTNIAGIEMKLPEDFEAFSYMPSSSYGMYVSFEGNKLGSMLVSELVPGDGMALSEFTQDVLATYMLSDYSDVKWSSFEAGKDFSEGVTYNLGKCTMKSAAGVELAGDVMVFEYEGLAFQFVVAIYAPDKSESTLDSSIDEVIASVNPENETMANYIIAWAVYTAAGLDTAQLSEPENLETANTIIQEVMNS